AIFSSTGSHGNSAVCWNTTPRSGPGPVTGAPSTVMSPLVAVSKPATRLRSVDLPHPLAPTIVMNCWSAISRLMSASAVTLPRRLANVLPRWVRLILATERLQAVPLKEMIADENNESVGEESQHSNAQHCSNHHVVAVELVRIVEKIAEPTADGQDLGHHNQHPGDAH